MENQNTKKNMIVYSLKVMEKLVERGHFPLQMMPNPKFPQYNCWIFFVDESFLTDFEEVQGEGKPRE